MKEFKESKNKTCLSEKFLFLLPAFLLTLVSLLFIYAEASIISPAKILVPVISLWAVLFLLIWPTHKITQSWAWTGASLAIIVIGFYLSETVFKTVTMLYFASFFSLSVIFWLTKRKLTSKLLAIASNIIALALLLFIFSYYINIIKIIEWVPYKNALFQSKNMLPVTNSFQNNRPDIYYIVLDGYARADILEQYYQFDNSEFIAYLTKKGFFVSKKSHSNYPKTLFSVTSTLNFDYIQKITAGAETSRLLWLINLFWLNNRTQLFLEQSGYTSISIASDWELSNNPTTDIYFKPSPIFLNEFDGFVLAKTPLKLFEPVLSQIAFVPSFESHRELILYNFEVLEKIAAMPEPTFTVAHIIAPHPPFVLDENGASLTPKYAFSFIDETSIPVTDEEYRNGYTAQIKFVNQKLETLIDSILAKSDTPPIIILQADHGPRRVTDLSSFDNKCQKERFAIFAAYHLPGLNKNPIPDNITPVNLFRIILNEYFSTNLPILENRSYSTEDIAYSYRFVDVTSELEKNCLVNP